MAEPERQGCEQGRASPPKPPIGIGSLVCAYALAVVFPIFGFVAGIHLWVSKKQFQHGVACITISCAVMFLELLLVCHL